MKRLLAAVLLVIAVAGHAAAEVRSIQVCQDKTLTANTTTDCTLADISKCEYMSYQVKCTETTDNSMSIDVDFIAGSAASSTYMGIPILSTGSALAQLQTAYTTEATWTTLETIVSPAAPVGTIRFTENNTDDDVVCSAILNCGFIQ